MTETERAQANLKVYSTEPLNAEPPLDRLAASFITAQQDLYIRTHGEVQHLDEATHRVRVTGRVARELELSVADLRDRFAPRTLIAGLQCAGNRRADLQVVAKTAGDPWSGGAVGNVRWTGASLRDVLEAAGADTGAELQVAFYSPDEIEVEGEKGRYGVSIPMPKALGGDVLLAWEIDGEPLLPEHGFPVRVVTPGYAGVRSPKWVTEVRVQDEPAESPIQRKDYKLFPASVSKEEADWDTGLTIDAMPLNSMICEPAQGARIAAGPVMVRGWATASERAVKRVDVSVDGGRHWSQAELEQDAAQPFAWTLWRLETELAKGEHEIVVRAFDEALQTQPDSPDASWNFAGYLAAHVHRIHVTAE